MRTRTFTSLIMCSTRTVLPEVLSYFRTSIASQVDGCMGTVHVVYQKSKIFDE